MKKTFKGFTLIECIVALAILGVASLTLAQIYARVAATNRSNHIVNTSLANQVAYVEHYSDHTASEAVGIYFNNDATTPDNEAGKSSATKYPPHKNTSASGMPHVKIVSGYSKQEYSYAADIYVMKSRDGNDKNSSDADYIGQAEDQYNLRYKYVIGHNN